METGPFEQKNEWFVPAVEQTQTTDASQEQAPTPIEENTAKKRKPWQDSVPISVLLTLALEEVGAILGGLLVGFFLGIYLLTSVAVSPDALPELLDAFFYEGLTPNLFPQAFSAAIDYLPTIGVWIVCLLWFLRKRDRPLYRTFTPYCKGNSVPMLLLGFAMGAVMNGACIGAAYWNVDIDLYFVSFRPLGLLAVFVCVFIQSSSEELICRGYLYQKLRKRFRSPAVAIFGNALLFALLHVFNPGVTVLAILDIFIFGVLASLIVYYWDSMWCAFALHTAWNFTQNIVFGLPNSGLPSAFSVFELDTFTARDSFFYNVDFGVEGTVFAVLIDTLGCVAVWLIGRRRGAKETDIWARERETVSCAEE